MRSLRKTLIGASIAIVIASLLLGGAIADRLFVIKPLDVIFPKGRQGGQPTVVQPVTKEESIIIDIAEKVSPSVVTVAIETPTSQVFEFSPFGGFGVQEQGGQRDVATGFIVEDSGIIVTNRHVVSGRNLTYKVITQGGEEFAVQNIYRDPANDLALLKIDPGATTLQAVALGDSDNLKVGQIVVAIGTALGEFRHTVTTGVISGLGRGITAGSVFQGYVERLDDVIQTDAAINPGNSGGPLLDSGGHVIGVSVAVAQGADNIGFAIPINILKESIRVFEETGEFRRPFLGVQYQIISQAAAIANEVPQGALVRDVVGDSAAARAGIQTGDIITKLGNEKISEENSLAVAINKHRVGETVNIEVWRDLSAQAGGETLTLSVTLQESTE